MSKKMRKNFLISVNKANRTIVSTVRETGFFGINLITVRVKDSGTQLCKIIKLNMIVKNGIEKFA